MGTVMELPVLSIPEVGMLRAYCTVTVAFQMPGCIAAALLKSTCTHAACTVGTAIPLLIELFSMMHERISKGKTLLAAAV